MTNFRWHLRFSLGALCLMLIVPFLIPHHYNPIPTFYQELTAAALGLLAATLLLRREVLARLEVPGIALLPLGLGALLLVQFASGQVVFATQALIFALYLLWALLLLILGRSLKQWLGLEGLITPLAYALLGGGVLSATLQGLQFGGSALDFIFRHQGGSGNLGQTNHLANYLWLGLASSIYLYAQGKFGKSAFAMLALILLASASLTGSRSILLYAAGFALLSGWTAWHYKQPALQKIFHAALVLLPITFLLQFTFAYLDFASTIGTSVSGERFFREVSGTSQRLQLWRTGLAIFAEHPWLGAGVGQFPWQAYILVGSRAGGTFIGNGENAHNLFIQLLAEFGIVAPLLALLPGLRWWTGFVRQDWSPAHWWIAAVLLIETVHSQLEYPLWYAFFLGIAALALGAGSVWSIRPRITRASRPIVALIFLLGGWTVFNLGKDYHELEHALNRPTQAPVFDSMERLRHESLFSHYVDLIYGFLLTVDHDALPEKILVTQRAIRLSPGQQSVFKLAYLLELNGQHAEAQLAWRRAVATHPAARTEALRQLAELAQHYPELKRLLDEASAQGAS